MDLKIIGEHIEVTEPIKEYIKQKFFHLPIPEKMNVAEFRIGKDNSHEQHVKFTSNFNHKNLTISVKSDNVYHAVDEIIKKIYIQINKNKEKNNHENHLVSPRR